MTDTNYQSRVSHLLPTKGYGEASNVTNEATVALYVIGFDLTLAVQGCTGPEGTGARIQLFDCDGNYLMTVAVFAGALARREALDAVPAYLALIPTWGWTKDYINPTHSLHGIKPDAHWGDVL